MRTIFSQLSDVQLLSYERVIFEHQAVGTRRRRVNINLLQTLVGFRKVNHFKSSFRIIVSSIISGKWVIYHLKERIITRQGIAHPLAVSATLPAVSPIFVSCSPGMPCRTAPTTLSPEPFLSCLRLIETAPNDGHTIISERLVIIISKMKVSFR